MLGDDVIAKVHGLCDVELALLLSLIANESPIISAPESVQDDLVEEIQLIAAKTFGLSCAVVRCTPQTTVDDFTAAIFRNPPPRSPSAFSPRLEYIAPRYPSLSLTIPPPASPGVGPTPTPPAVPTSSAGFQTPNIVVAKDLNLAPLPVQMQALEMLRATHVFTRNKQTKPAQFMILPVLIAERSGDAKLAPHLNEHFFMAHFHHPDMGFVYLGEDEDDMQTREDDESVRSTVSVVKRLTEPSLNDATFSEADLAMLTNLSNKVSIDTEVLRYQLNIIAFLRLHRAVSSGISPTATRHLEKLCRCLAPLHRIDFVTPALVVLATRKIYPHRIIVASARQERSMQWGSDGKAIAEALEEIGPEEVIEDVLDIVTAPV
ncbi:hypothetical protein TD95_004347 [Thielaviopsis punctulata]|uniref:magnesium chelatase n=1 Tax=Thielaviopsis punctulata TaxID=72032 RepID=A0A0F4Z948_9PEZI|nr:hypothetical protein TD95_004347 [Thielaviopsis punctulata]